MFKIVLAIIVIGVFVATKINKKKWDKIIGNAPESQLREKVKEVISGDILTSPEILLYRNRKGEINIEVTVRDIGEKNKLLVPKEEVLVNVMREIREDELYKITDKVVFRSIGHFINEDGIEENHLKVGVIFNKEIIGKIDWINIKDKEVIGLGEQIYC